MLSLNLKRPVPHDRIDRSAGARADESYGDQGMLVIRRSSADA
jgi:hypothetical protein